MVVRRLIEKDISSKKKKLEVETAEIAVEEYHFERYIDTDINIGLSSDVVLKRQEHGYNNIVNNNKGKTVGKIIRDNLLTFFNLLYFVITVLLCLAQSWNNLTFLPVIISNTIIGIVQEIKAKK